MSKLDKPFQLDADMAMRLPDDVCIVARARELEALRSVAGASLPSNLDLTALDPSVPIPTDLIARASVLVMEVDQNDLASLRRIDQVRTLRPSLPLIVALKDANLVAVRTLIRQGVDDVCSIPIDFDELYGQVCDLAAKLQNNTAAKVELCPLIAVVRSTGGSGATSVATHLSAALSRAEESNRGACLVDLDIQFGNVATSLGREPASSVIELLEAGNRLDADLLSSATVASGRGFDIIAAPADITPLESIDVDQLLHLLLVARREYDAIVVDLPANWTNWTLSAVLAATDVLLVTELTIAGLRQAKRRLDLFATVGVPKERIRVVVNRVEKRIFRTIGVDEVRRTLGHPVFATLSSDGPMLASSQDQGLLSWESNRKSRFAHDVGSLAAQLREGWKD